MKEQQHERFGATAKPQQSAKLILCDAIVDRAEEALVCHVVIHPLDELVELLHTR